MARRRHVWCVLVLVSVLSGTSGAARDTGGIPAITAPSADVTLAFLQAGRMAKVLVKEGDKVAVGQVLLQQDDATELIQLAQAEADSNDMSRINAADAGLAQKRVDLKKLEWAAGRGAATELEVEHAKLDVKIAELALDVAKFDHEQAKRRHEEAKIRVEIMRLKSPIDGSVEKIDIEVGESVQALEGVIRIVKTDPLWIDVYVPLNQARTLAVGQSTEVEFPGPRLERLQGQIVFVATAADAASDTLRVRVELANKSGRPSGEHVLVTFKEVEKRT
jgi:RND family efflux transporter MFP subunit